MVATSAVTAALLDGGHNAHSVFQIPVPCDDGAQCAVTADSEHGRDSSRCDCMGLNCSVFKERWKQWTKCCDVFLV